MKELPTSDAYGVLTEPATLKIQRLLPGPIERVWAYLTESELRRQWLAARVQVHDNQFWRGFQQTEKRVNIHSYF